MFKNRSHICRLILDERWLFASVIQDTIVIVGLKLLTDWDKPDKGALWTGNEIKFVLKIVRKETDIATHTCKLLLRKK